MCKSMLSVCYEPILGWVFSLVKHMYRWPFLSLTAGCKDTSQKKMNKSMVSKLQPVPLLSDNTVN